MYMIYGNSIIIVTELCLTIRLTYDVQERHRFTQVVPVGPPVVVPQVLPQIIEQNLFLLLLLGIRTNGNVQVHHQRPDFTAFPVFPQPSWRIEQYRLCEKYIIHLIL